MLEGERMQLKYLYFKRLIFNVFELTQKNVGLILNNYKWNV